jgi:hypothetical protein
MNFIFFQEVTNPINQSNLTMNDEAPKYQTRYQERTALEREKKKQIKAAKLIQDLKETILDVRLRERHTHCRAENVRDIVYQLRVLGLTDINDFSTDGPPQNKYGYPRHQTDQRVFQIALRFMEQYPPMPSRFCSISINELY